MMGNLPTVWFIVEVLGNRETPNPFSIDTANPEVLFSKYIHNSLTTSPVTTVAQATTACPLDFSNGLQTDLPGTVCDPPSVSIKTTAQGFLLEQTQIMSLLCKQTSNEFYPEFKKLSKALLNPSPCYFWLISYLYGPTLSVLATLLS